MQVIMSGANPKGFALYGQKFVDTFTMFWPKEYDFIFFVEEPVHIPDPRTFEWSWLWSIPNQEDFIKKHSQIPEHVGRSPVPGWSPKSIARGYDYRFDAVKWSRQCFIPDYVINMADDGDIVVWLDADIVTFKPVPANFIESMIGDFDLLHLGRDRGDSEIGFWAVRVNKKTRDFAQRMSDHFAAETVFNLAQWHSGFVFDRSLEILIKEGGKVKSLNLGNYHGHVWFETPLGDYTDHLKGDRRKLKGYSQECKVRWWREGGPKDDWRSVP